MVVEYDALGVIRVILLLILLRGGWLWLVDDRVRKIETGVYGERL